MTRAATQKNGVGGICVKMATCAEEREQMRLNEPCGPSAVSDRSPRAGGYHCPNYEDKQHEATKCHAPRLPHSPPPAPVAFVQQVQDCDAD